jgi:RNA polymerase sigma-70 factor (ECF subfamily)
MVTKEGAAMVTKQGAAETLPGWPTTLQRVSSLSEDAVGSLIEALTPTVRARVARVLAREGTFLASEREDLAQDILLRIFVTERVIEKWDPSRGRSLKSFVGLVAERMAARAARRIARSAAFHSGEREPPEEEAAHSELDLEARMIAREKLAFVFEEFQSQLSKRAFDIFRSLFLEQDSIVNISENLGLSPEAVYAWRSRLLKRIRELNQRFVATAQRG